MVLEAVINDMITRGGHYSDMEGNQGATMARNETT